MKQLFLTILLSLMTISSLFAQNAQSEKDFLQEHKDVIEKAEIECSGSEKAFFESAEMQKQIVEYCEKQAKENVSWQQICQNVCKKWYKLRNALSLGNGIYFLNYELMISVDAEPSTYYLCLTYGTKEKQILNCSYKTTQKIPLNFHKKEFGNETVLYWIGDFSHLEGNAHYALCVDDAFTFDPLATELLFYSSKTEEISFEKKFKFEGNHLYVHGSHYDFENSTWYDGFGREYYFALHYTCYVQRLFIERLAEAGDREHQHPHRWAYVKWQGGDCNFRLPMSDFEAKNFGFGDFQETDDGFSLSFDWGGGNYLWYETFFFKEIGDEYCLYKIKSDCTTPTGDNYEYETESETRILKTPVKASELTTERIMILLGRGDFYKITVNCPDSDFGKKVQDRTMHLEVKKDGELSEVLNYEIKTENGFTAVNKKYFEMADLNFDGYDDIVILSGYTMRGAQPFYDVYFWNIEKGCYELNPPFWEDFSPTYLALDSEKRLIYSMENTTHGILIYQIHEFNGSSYELKGTLYFNYTNDEYSYDYGETSVDEDGQRPETGTWLEKEQLSDEWKRAISCKRFEF